MSRPSLDDGERALETELRRSSSISDSPQPTKAAIEALKKAPGLLVSEPERISPRDRMDRRRSSTVRSS